MSQSNSGITQRSSFCHPERSEGSGHWRFFGFQPQNDNDWKKTCAYCKIAILIIYFLIVLGCFKFFLSSATEAFFMSIPILAVLGAGIFKDNLTQISKKEIVAGGVNILVLFVVTVAMFQHLAKLMFGRIVWSEVFLAGYFLISVGILVILLKSFVGFAAGLISQNVKNIFIKKSVYWIIVGLFWILIIFPFLLETFALHRPKIGDQINPQSELGLAYENVYFKTKDNILLHGWFIPVQSNKAVIVGHGLGANKSNFISVAQFWHNLGFNVLIFDFRGHGQSQGHTISLGYKERYDIEAGLDYLSMRKDIDPQKIIGYGVSFGGAAMIQAAAEDLRLKAIIIDSSFANVDGLALQTVERIGFLPSVFVKMIARIGLSMASLECDFDLLKFSTERAIAQVKQPVLLVHGKRDTLISWKETEKLYATAHQPKFLHFFETQGHYTTMSEPGYKMIIQNFLLNNFSAS